MLGTSVSDPAGVEAGKESSIRGFGCLPMDTVFEGEKIQTQTSGIFKDVKGLLSPLNGQAYEGYEIHMGRSENKVSAVTGNENVFGSYIHGIFDAPGVAETVLKVLCGRKGADFSELKSFDMDNYKDQQYDKLADAVRSGLDMDLVYRIIGL